MKTATEMRNLVEEVERERVEQVRADIIKLCEDVVMDKIFDAAREGKVACVYKLYDFSEEEKQYFIEYLTEYGYKVSIDTTEWACIEW